MAVLWSPVLESVAAGQVLVSNRELNVNLSLATRTTRSCRGGSRPAAVLYLFFHEICPGAWLTMIK
jgi:hypothetical protein